MDQTLENSFPAITVSTSPEDSHKQAWEIFFPEQRQVNAPPAVNILFLEQFQCL